MKENKNYYITTTLPYVNAEPHVGFAMELVRADALARHRKIQGYDVFFNTGTDEHGQKILIAAEKEGKTPKEYCDYFSGQFFGLHKILNISGDINFIRTTDENHIKSAQALWNKCNENGYIYKKNYEAKYCVGCELEKTDSELDENGQCPIHPGKDLELIKEENYFFKWSEFQDKLLRYYNDNPSFVVPHFRFNEIKAFVERGLQDFSISRLRSKMSWGIPVPGDEGHVMYVWFDALTNYISTLGWASDDDSRFEKFWQNGITVQYCGKDNLRQQSAMWQAMLLACGIKNTNHIVINGFFNGAGGIKMSKSIGNVINPYDVIQEFGTDAFRFYVLGAVSSFEDSSFAMDLFKDAYNTYLANGIGNLASRIMKMATTYLPTKVDVKFELPLVYVESIDEFNWKKCCDYIYSEISFLDKRIQETEPFKLIKTDKDKAEVIVSELVEKLYEVARMLLPIIPESAQKIVDSIENHQMLDKPLFERK